VADVVREIAFLMYKNFGDVTETVDERPGQDAAYIIDSSKARNRFGWQPEIALRAGLEETIAWVERNWSEIQAEPLEYEHRA
jgi:dTDP-glucose 4,6-dehydratase